MAIANDGEAPRDGSARNPPATLTARRDAPAQLSPSESVAAADTLGVSALPAEILARYESIEIIGRGGMGVVYRARDRWLRRDVALKLLFHDRDGRGRDLLEEGRSLARLDHEHACKVYEVGVASGKPYLVMQLIDGAPFGQATPMTVLEKVTIVRQVALALHQAHELGLVHRDVKPSNIMVERAEDGAWKPYLTDFGIAREIGESGKTVTGAIAGTPAFMAPEQARGEVRSLDARTDVYSLGATLYDVLAGRPPFTASNAWMLLQKITVEEAPPIRTLSRALPEDLEAILARCLEKEPRRRYDSAKALGEDLQRFLDGDPVHARRLSLGYVLLRRARKHWIIVSLSAAALVAGVVVMALAVRARRLADDQAMLSRELGENVKEMELFLRSAYGLPLHDAEREKDVVRARLQSIEARMAAAGRAGEGPGHYALGRGHLALQEPEDALTHLERARAAGYTSPDLDYALGLALGVLFTKGREAAQRIDNPARKAAREAELKTQYEEPARRHLRASLGARLETAAYVEGLLFLYEGDPEAALAKAGEAFATMPWLYEAKILEGDARFAIGSRFRHDGAFEYEKMNTEFQAATESYGRAAEIARSDPRVHLAECELWAQRMNGASARAESLKPSYENAKAACGRAITASSRSDDARLKLAFVQVNYAWRLATGSVAEDPSTVLEDAIAQGKAAMLRSPGDPMAPYILGEAWRTRAQYQNDRGLDSTSSIALAIAAFEESIRLHPTFLWALQGLNNVYALRAVSEIYRGRDPAPALERSLEYCQRGRVLDSSYLPSRTSAIIAHIVLAEDLVERGRDPALPLSLALADIEAARELSPDWPADYFFAYVHWLKAEHALDAARDPGDSLPRGLEIARELVKRSPESPEAHEALGKLEQTRARVLMLRAEDPEPALREARSSFLRAAEGRSWHVSFVVWRARVESAGLRWAAKAGSVRVESFRAAARPLLALLTEQERVDPSVYQVVAEMHATEASWLFARGTSPDQAVSAGLAMVERALALNPHMARALFTKGSLLAVRSRAARLPQVRRDAARSAEATLAAAAQENPRMEREIEAARAELPRD